MVVFCNKLKEKENFERKNEKEISDDDEVIIDFTPYKIVY